MNQGKMWTVVNPTVGIPLFLGGVVLMSLTVHAAVLTHSTWYASFLAGGTKAKTAMNDAAPSAVQPAAVGGYSVTVAPAPQAAGSVGTAFVVTVAPNAALASADPVHAAPPDTLAMAVVK